MFDDFWNVRINIRVINHRKNPYTQVILFLYGAAGIRNFKKFWTKSEADKPAKKAKNDSKDSERKTQKADEKKAHKSKKTKNDDSDKGDVKPPKKAKNSK